MNNECNMIANCKVKIKRNNAAKLCIDKEPSLLNLCPGKFTTLHFSTHSYKTNVKIHIS